MKCVLINLIQKNIFATNSNMQHFLPFAAGSVVALFFSGLTKKSNNNNKEEDAKKLSDEEAKKHAELQETFGFLPEAFDMNGAMEPLFRELAKFKYADSDAFAAVAGKTDSILKRERSMMLDEKRQSVRVMDKIHTELYYKEILDILKRWKKKVTSSKLTRPQDFLRFEECMHQLQTLLERHVVHISHMSEGASLIY
jgi:hypothetical protein